MLHLTTQPQSVTSTTPIKVSKPKLNPADYKLLFIRINEIRTNYNKYTSDMERVFYFEHTKNRYAAADHIWSSDKNSVSHCYRDLEADKHYVIFAHSEPSLVQKKKNGDKFNRWVWKLELPMSDQQLRKAYDFWCKHPAPEQSSERTRDTLKFADNLINPKISPVLDEFEFTTPQVDE